MMFLLLIMTVNYLLNKINIISTRLDFQITLKTSISLVLKYCDPVKKVLFSLSSISLGCS